MQPTTSPGMDLYAQMRYDEAADVLYKELEEQPHNSILARYFAFSLCGANKPKEAVAAALRAVEINAADPENHFALGFASATNLQMNEAISAFEKALDIAPNHAASKKGLIDALLKRGRMHIATYDTSMAEADFYRAAHLDRKNPVAAISLFEFYQEQQHRANAEKTLREALVHLPNDPSIRNAAVSFGIDINKKLSQQQAATAARDAIRQNQATSAPQPAYASTAANAGNVPCPFCKLMVPSWVAVCPHCRERIQGSAEKIKTPWQEITYKILAGLWILVGLLQITTGIMAGLAPGQAANVQEFTKGFMIIMVMFGLVALFVGIGLFVENETAQFVCKILCYLNLAIYSYQFMINLLMSTELSSKIVPAVISLAMLSFVGLQIYVLRYVGGD